MLAPVVDDELFDEQIGRADVQADLLPLVTVRERVDRAVQHLQAALHMRVEEPSVVRERQLVPVARKQLHAQLILQRPDHLAQGGLGDPQFLCRAGQVFMARGGTEVAQMQ